MLEPTDGEGEPESTTRHVTEADTLTQEEQERLGALVQRLAFSGVLTEDSIDAKRLAFVLYLKDHGYISEGQE